MLILKSLVLLSLAAISRADDVTYNGHPVYRDAIFQMSRPITPACKGSAGFPLPDFYVSIPIGLGDTANYCGKKIYIWPGTTEGPKVEATILGTCIRNEATCIFKGSEGLLNNLHRQGDFLWAIV